MASSTAFPGTAANDNSAGDTAWTNTNNIKVDDSSFASSTISSSNKTQYLVASNFGFAISSNAIIQGIEVEINRKAYNSNRISDYEVLLIDTGGSQYGNNKADTGTFWPTTAVGAAVTYGGSSDVWGSSIDYADVNASTFGVAIRASTTIESTAYVDYVKVTVHYVIEHNLALSVSQEQVISLDLIRQVNLALSVSQQQTFVGSLSASMFLAALFEQRNSLASDLYYTRPLPGVSFEQLQTIVADLYYTIGLSSISFEQSQTLVGGKLIGWAYTTPDTVSWTPSTAETVVWTEVIGDDETWA